MDIMASGRIKARKRRQALVSVIPLFCVVAAIGAFALWLYLSSPETISRPLLDLDEINGGLTRLTHTGDAFQTVASNADYELQYNPATASVAMLHKATGKIVSTDPIDAVDDTFAKGANAALNRSQLVIYYADDANHIGETNSWTLSVANGQVSYYAIEGGVRVSYLFKEKSDEFLMPRIISYDAFKNELLPRVADPKDRRKVQDVFAPHFFAADEFDETLRKELQDFYGKKTFIALEPEELADLNLEYPGIETWGNTFTCGVTGIKARSVQKIFEANGFTEEDKAHWEEPFTQGEAPQLIVTASVDYVLENDSLVVTLPASELSSSEGYRVTGVQLLPNFGAVKAGDDGFALVPDGSGAVVRFSGKARRILFNLKPLYGDDPAIQLRLGESKSQSLLLPMFGIAGQNQGLLGVIEQGDALGLVYTRLAGHVTGYNSNFAEFTISTNTRISLKALEGQNIIRLYQREPYEGDIKVRYYMLTGDDVSLADMAAAARNHLINTGALDERLNEGDYPFTVDILMNVNKDVPVIGVPVYKSVPTTTFSEAESIVNELLDSGVGDVALRLSGWREGGLTPRAGVGLAPDPAIGGKSGFKSLVDLCETNGVELYPSYNSMIVSYATASLIDTITGRFSNSDDAIHTLNQNLLSLFHYNQGTGIIDGRFYGDKVASAAARQTWIERTSNEAADLGVNLALDGEGSLLTSDFTIGREVNREQAKAFDIDMLVKLSDNRKVMQSAAYGYAIAIADHITDLPMSSSLLDIYDESVPFYQMILHGYMEYSTVPINTDDFSAEKLPLMLLETGSSPSYLWMNAPDETLKYSNRSYLYSLQYEQWLSDAVLLWRELDAVLGRLAPFTMTERTRLTTDVVRTAYEDGTTIHINYGKTAWRGDGVSVPALSYKVTEGGNP